MLTQTETQSKNLLWISNNRVCFYPHLNIKKLNSREIEERNVLTKSIIPYTKVHPCVLRNWFLAQSLRSLIMLSFQDKIQPNASIFIVILHNFSLHIKSTNLFWRERGDEKRKRDDCCCYERGEERCWGRKKRWGEKGKGEERERKKVGDFLSNFEFEYGNEEGRYEPKLRILLS